MLVVVATVQEPFFFGGAERLAEGLLSALRDAGHEAEMVALPWLPYPMEEAESGALGFRLLDLDRCDGPVPDLVIGLKFPAYLIRHSGKVLWILHQHRPAYDLWPHPMGLSHSAGGAQTRSLIRRLDRRTLAESRAVFTISERVSQRLEEHLGFRAPALHPPHDQEDLFHRAPDRGYLFMPSRTAPLKRQDLVLTALARTKQPVRLVFSGNDRSEYGQSLREISSRLGLENRVEWKGRVSDRDLAQLYAESRGVVFPPFDEDYGYVALEAMLSSKPLLTCTDSGGTVPFVGHGESGLVVDPSPQALAEGMDELWESTTRAAAWGEAGRRRYEALGLSWSIVVEKLLACG